MTKINVYPTRRLPEEYSGEDYYSISLSPGTRTFEIPEISKAKSGVFYFSVHFSSFLSDFSNTQIEIVLVERCRETIFNLWRHSIEEQEIVDSFSSNGGKVHLRVEFPQFFGNDIYIFTGSSNLSWESSFMAVEAVLDI